ncbi:MAG: vWA domain-containing protein, partial [Gemmatimonadales bacterium]
FTSYYRENTEPEFVLRPPPGWPERPAWLASAGCDEDLRSIHRRLYDPALLRPRNKQPSLVTYGEIISALERTAPDISIRLLGGHGQTDVERAADSSGRDSRITNALPKLVSGVSVLREGLQGAGRGGEIETRILNRVQKERRLELALAVLLRKSFLRQSSGSKRWLEERVPAISVDRTRDRRAVVRHVMSRELGLPQPLLFSSETTRLRPAPCAAPIYLDVSGSMYGLLERLYAALIPLRRQLLPEMFAFSTVVTPISKADFDAGRISTTGGTSIQPVIDHVIESSRRSGARVAVVLTDGHFTAPSKRSAAAISTLGIKVHLGVLGLGPLNDSERWVASATRLPDDLLAEKT